MPKKYGLGGWVFILAAMAVVGFVVVGSYLVQTQQRLRAVEIELGRAKEETVRAKAGALETAKVVENLRLELEAARDEYQVNLDKAKAAVAELGEKLDAAQSDLGKKQSQLQAMEAGLNDAKQATDQAKAEAAQGAKQIARLTEEIALERQALQSEVDSLNRAASQAKADAAEREKQIAKLRRGIASCEEFVDEWEVRGAPVSISAIAALGREAAAAKDCIDRGDVETACKHWRGLLVEIEKLGPPISQSRSDIEELMRQNRCEEEGNSASN
jgi:chromosome segregation ATPase